jgi:hypothetical protein
MASRNCKTCATKMRLPDQPNENGGDFYRCTAVIRLPRFGQMDRQPSDVQRMVNLAMFEPEHPCFEWAMQQDCPLHTLLQSTTLEDTPHG